MQIEEAETSGDSIPLSTRGALRISVIVGTNLVFDHTRAAIQFARVLDAEGSGLAG